MVKHIWSVLCERASVDQNTNLVSYLTCTEGLTAKKLPAIIQNLALGSRWHGKPNDKFRLRLLLFRPDRTKKQLLETEDHVFKDSNHRTFIILDGLPLEQGGDYIFRLEIRTAKDWKVVHDIPLSVISEDKEQIVDTKPITEAIIRAHQRHKKGTPIKEKST